MEGTPPLHLRVLLLALLLDTNVAFPFFSDSIESLLTSPSPPATKKPEFETSFAGWWELVLSNSGVSAMHLAITKENKAIMFDATNFGPSQLKKLPPGNCRIDRTKPNNPVEDCWAHAVEYDFISGELRPLKVLTNPWCSSGGFAADGTIVQAGGFSDGGAAVRYLETCPTCDWVEYPTAMSVKRWYATQQILPDGSFIVVGGRRQFSYEIIPARGQSNPSNYALRFLVETTDDVENNLYPFLHLSTDGNVFLFANNRSILLDPKTNTVVREFPPLSLGSFNYPASAASTLLPLRLRSGTSDRVPAEVIICGGASHQAATLAAEKKIFEPALRTCSRLTITSPNAKWHTEEMPTPRVMADLLILPNAELLIINGATRGTSGWGWGASPNLEPLLYRPSAKRGSRFTRLSPATIPRMYHSTSAVLPDGSILVAGSNPNVGYNYTAEYPTELRVEKFYPPYLDQELAVHRLAIGKETAPSVMNYGASFVIGFTSMDVDLELADLMVTMLAPPFTTHGYSMGQRMLLLRATELTPFGFGRWQVAVRAPPSEKLAPPGYYLVFVVNRGVPSEGVWIQVQ